MEKIEQRESIKANYYQVRFMINIWMKNLFIVVQLWGTIGKNRREKPKNEHLKSSTGSSFLQKTIAYKLNVITS